MTTIKIQPDSHDFVVTEETSPPSVKVTIAEEKATDAEKLGGLITRLYEEVDKEVIPPRSFAATTWFPGAKEATGYALVLQKLSEARVALNAKEEPKAERLYHEAQGLYRWCELNAGWADKQLKGLPVTRWFGVVLYEFAWLVAAVAIAQGVLGGDPDTMKLLGVPVKYLAWGTIGGVSWAIFGVWFHTIRGDFDPGYLPWYFTKPLLGAIAGGLVFLLAELIKGNIADNSNWNDNLLFFAAFVLGFFEGLLINVLETLRKKVEETVSAMLGQTQAPAA